MLDHPSVAQRVGAHTVEVKEFGDSLIVGAQQLRMYVGFNRRTVDFGESMVDEEVHLEGQAEHSGDAEFDCHIEKLLQDQVSNTPAPPRSINGQSQIGRASCRERV